MKSIPENDFAVIRDQERNLIVDCGTYGQCLNDAGVFNRIYQSTAYVAELWRTK